MVHKPSSPRLSDRFGNFSAGGEFLGEGSYPALNLCGKFGVEKITSEMRSDSVYFLDAPAGIDESASPSAEVFAGADTSLAPTASA